MIPTFLPLLEKEELLNAHKSLKEKYLGIGKYVHEFEKICSEKIHVKKDRVVSVNTGFSALHLSCMLFNIKKGDEVIMPSLTNVADAQVVISLGAKIVFCDILPETFCINPDQINNLITKKTKLIIPIDYGCNLAAHDELKFLSKKYNIPILHDASHSFGSLYKNKNIGNIHDLTTFSFDPVKTFTSIDGGLIICKNKSQAKKLFEMRLMGIEKVNGTTTSVKRLGYRYHLANLHAAIGIEQIKKINLIKKNRIKYFNFYNKSLQNVKNLKTPKILEITNVIPFHYCIRVKKRKAFMKFLLKKKIQTGIHWTPLHFFKYFKEHSRFKRLDVTEKIGREIVTLPFHSKMKISTLKYIVNEIKKFS